MNKYVQFFIMVSLWNLSLTASQEKPLTLTESIIVGGIAGGFEVLAPGHLFTVAMNKKINNLPFVWHQAHKGGLTNLLGQMSIIAVQKGTKDQLSKNTPAMQDSLLTELANIGISFASGVSGALIDTPCNALQLYLQHPKHPANERKSALQACMELGLKRSFKGFGANAFMKEGIFAVGYQILALKGKEIAQKYVGDNLKAFAIGGAGAGVITAILTQPGAVIRGKMQNDFSDVVYTSTGQTMQKIFKEEGLKAFWRGLPERGGRIAIAIPLLVMYSDFLEKWIKE